MAERTDRLTPPSGSRWSPAMSVFVASAESPAFRSMVGLEWIHPPAGPLEQAVTLPAAMCDADGRPALGVLAILADSTLGTAAAASRDGAQGIVTLGLHVDLTGGLPACGSTMSLRAEGVAVDHRHVWVKAHLAHGEHLIGWATWRGLFVDFARRHARLRGEAEVAPVALSEDAGPVGSVDDLLRLRVQGRERGEVRVLGFPPPSFASGWRTLHGGAVGLLAERAAHHARRPGVVGAVHPLSLDVEFFRPVPNGPDRLATGTVVHQGRSYVTSEGRVVIEGGRLAALARTTALLSPPRRPALPTGSSR